MHPLNKLYAVRPDHVSAVRDVAPVPNRPGLFEYEVHLIGGQILSISGSKDDMDAKLTGLIRAIEQIDGAPR